MIQAVILDVVGTVLYASPPVDQAYHDVARSLGSELRLDQITSRFQRVFAEREAQDLRSDLRTGERIEIARWREIVRAVVDDIADPDRAFELLFEHFARASSWRLFPDVQPALDLLVQRRVRIGLASNFDRRLFRILAEIPGLARCETVVVSSQVGYRKPHPGFFRAVVSSAGLEAHQLLYVGDSVQNDYVGARAAGLNAVLIARNETKDRPVQAARQAEAKAGLEPVDRLASLTDIIPLVES